MALCCGSELKLWISADKLTKKGKWISQAARMEICGLVWLWTVLKQTHKVNIASNIRLVFCFYSMQSLWRCLGHARPERRKSTWLRNLLFSHKHHSWFTLQCWLWWYRWFLAISNQSSWDEMTFLLRNTSCLLYASAQSSHHYWLARWLFLK